ncbi:MAG: type II toxin-antitoxin system VapB family antitoxin [Mycobacteriales bacterium]
MLNIKDPETDRLARRLADTTGETITAAVATAVRERLERLTHRRRHKPLAAQLDEIALRCAALPVLDTRSQAQILGYDEQGIPGS